MPRGGPRLRTEDGSMNTVGRRVRQRRLALRLTHNALIAALAMQTDGLWNPAPQEIQHIARGIRTVTDTELLALARALECSPCWLLTGRTSES